MVEIIDLVKYALTYFYPKKRVTYDNTIYESLEEKYMQWINTTYCNGDLYINEDNIVLNLTSNRSIVDNIAYILEKDNKVYFLVKSTGFRTNQEVEFTVKYSYKDEKSGVKVKKQYTTTAKRHLGSNYLMGDITQDNLNYTSILNSTENNKVVIKTTDAILENYMNYTKVPSVSFTGDKLVSINEKDLTILLKNKFITIIQKYSSPIKAGKKNIAPKNKPPQFILRLKGLRPSFYQNLQIIDMRFKAYVEVIEDEPVEDPSVTGSVSDDGTVTPNDDGKTEDEGSTAPKSKTQLFLVYDSGDVLAQDVVEEGYDDEIVFELYEYDEKFKFGNFTKLELELSVNTYKEYSGLKVKMVFTDIIKDGNYYTPTSVEYIY